MTGDGVRKAEDLQRTSISKTACDFVLEKSLSNLFFPLAKKEE